MKVPYKVEVHIYGKGFDESFWIMIENHYTMYRISTVWPNGTKNTESCVCDYEVIQEVMALVAKLYEKEQINYINMTWIYPEKELT